jgi:Na+-transporting methylmalonyl-CoA/oxaloacetate decarboxylase gamma subunit
LPKSEDIEKIARNILAMRRAVDRQLNHPLSRQLDKITNRYTLFHSIQVDVISSDPAAVYEAIKSKPAAFSGLAKSAFVKKFEVAKSKLWRAGINSVIYIFLTKSIFVVALEVPATKYFGEELNLLTLGINIIFPPFLLLLVILFTRVSSDANNKKVVTGVEEITFEEKNRRDPMVLRKPAKRGVVTSFIFNLLYSFTFIISFGSVVWLLDKINFTWVSILIFLFFLVLVSFFGIRIRRSVRLLIVEERQESLLNFVLDFFFVPIAMVGKWLSNNFSKINVFMFIMDFVLEAPFKVVVEIAEQWTKYVRERKEDVD